MAVTFSITAQVEDSDRQSPTFGLKAGANYSNVSDEQGQDFQADCKLGFAGGLFIGILIGKVFGFQPELMISLLIEGKCDLKSKDVSLFIS